MPDSVWGTEGGDDSDESDTPRGPASSFGAGPAPKNPVVGRPDRAQRRSREPEPVPDWLKSDHGADASPPTDRDPVAVAAVACGFVGIVFFGIAMAIVTAILAGTAGQRARESGRTFELPYLAYGLAFVDAAIWLVLHFVTKTPIWVG